MVARGAARESWTNDNIPWATLSLSGPRSWAIPLCMLVEMEEPVVSALDKEDLRRQDPRDMITTESQAIYSRLLQPLTRNGSVIICSLTHLLDAESSLVDLLPDRTGMSTTAILLIEILSGLVCHLSDILGRIVNDVRDGSSDGCSDLGETVGEPFRRMRERLDAISRLSRSQRSRVFDVRVGQLGDLVAEHSCVRG
jgi:hypothetical protein